MRQLRVRAAMVGVAAATTWTWTVALCSAAASASTRLRSGSLHAQLASRVTPAGGTTPAGLLAGSDVMAGVVGALAVLSLAYLIVTFIRRRATLG